MKRWILVLIAITVILTTSGCKTTEYSPTVAATTLPVYEFTSRLCDGTGITAVQLITESVSCLHDYTLQVSQMKSIEIVDSVVISGAGLEDFLYDALPADKAVIDASAGIALLCPDHDHEAHDEHSHEQDPHIWLAPNNAKIMAANIRDGLSDQYPQHADIFQKNFEKLCQQLDALQAFGAEQLSSLRCRELLTFHDGFAYLADAFDLTILRSVEEESGSEASAAELIELCQLVSSHDLPAIFTEVYGSTSAASIISMETGAKTYQLDMAMGANSYFDAMYHNIETLKEALE